MRVAVYIPELEPSSGGGFTFQQSILESLSQSDCKHEFIVFCNKTNNYINKKLNIISLENYKFFNDAMIENKIELVWFLSPCYRNSELPFIFTVWDLQHRMQPYFPEVNVTGYKWDDREHLYGRIIPRASFVITGNEAGKEEIINFYRVPAERIKTIPFPTPQFVLNNYTESIDIFSKFNINSPYLFYPAQFWPHKNHIAILLAVKILKELYNLNFSVIFTGSDKGNLEYIKEQAEKLNIENLVNFAGFVCCEELISIYKNAFAMVFPSFFGPDNIPPLEAFGLGCPVIASNVHGTEYQFEDAALLFNPKDENELALSIKKLHDNPTLRESFIQKGLNLSKKWTADDYVSEVCSLITDFVPIRRCWSSESPYKHT